MTTIYEFSSVGAPTGNTREIGPRDGIPPNWTAIAPPEGKYVVFVGAGWDVYDALPAAPPISLTVGEFVSRFRVPDENAVFEALDDAMAGESRLVRRQWANDGTVMTEGEGLWEIVSSHLEGGGLALERLAELLAPGPIAA